MFILLGQEDLEVLSDLRNAESLPVVSDKLSEEDIETMRRLLRSGISRNRNKAIKMGTAAASAKGGVAPSVLAGAAIGSILLPGIGTAVGTILAGFYIQNARNNNRRKGKSVQVHELEQRTR